MPFVNFVLFLEKVVSSYGDFDVRRTFPLSGVAYLDAEKKLRGKTHKSCKYSRS